ncbi:LAFE_0F02520g1_1 [Lachancea fermentati]|uniref:Protein HIR n=1 Tax=Lachancea fermentati TaxID=4955 RepID=A0A1G4MEQ2_LACFM|nr:LAFE_0F02520g1_1 [Lachancea fermentati]
MKLLRYPRKLTSGKISSCCCIGDNFITVGNNSISVFSSEELMDAALGKRSAKSVLEKFSIAAKGIDQPLQFCFGDENRLFLGTDLGVYHIESWLETREKSDIKSFYSVKAPSTITDTLYDPKNRIVFILVNKSDGSNFVLLYSANSCKQLGDIPMTQSKPMTGIIDPVGQVFTVICDDRYISVFQYDKEGNHKLLHRLTQYVQVDPIHYKITMSPQADLLPILNSLKGTTPAIALLDKNKEFKVDTTLVGHLDQCKILKFSPKLYEKTIKNGTTTTYNLLATSGFEDGHVIVWNTRRSKPLLNAKCLCNSYITDLQWTHDGLGLLAVSNDGYLFIFAFHERELGQVVSEDQISKLQSGNKKLDPLIPTEEPVIKNEAKPELIPTIPNGTASRVNGKKRAIPTTIKSSTMEFNAPSYSVPKDLKRRPKEDLGSQTNSKRQKHDLEPMDFLDTNLLIPNISFSKLRLATPKVRLTFQYVSPSNSNLIFDVKNGSGNEQKPSIVSLLSKESDQEKVLFHDFLPNFVTLCTSGDTFWACCSENGTIYVYSDSGKKVLPPMIMGVPCSFLEACGKFLLCVTSMGQAYCWNVENSKLEFPVTTVYPLLSPTLRFSDDVLTRAENITMCTITKGGIPLVTLSNGDGYMFDKDMQTWLVINDSWWAFGSQYWDATRTTGNTIAAIGMSDKGEKKNKYWNSEAEGLLNDLKENKSSILNYLESRTNDELSRKGRIRNIQKFAKTILMKEGFENLEEVVTLAHLENKLLVLLRLSENGEFVKLLIVYCIRLSEMGYRNRLDDVLQWIYNDGDYKNKEIAGVNAEVLLKKILVACADIRHVQRVTTNYATAIGMIADSL